MEGKEHQRSAAVERTDFWYQVGLDDGRTHILDPFHPSYLGGCEYRPPHFKGVLGLSLFLSREEKAENVAYEKGFRAGVAQRYEEARRKYEIRESEG